MKSGFLTTSNSGNFLFYEVVLKNELYKKIVRGKIILILRLFMTIYWICGWSYRLADFTQPQIPYVQKNITLNEKVIKTITVEADIWFNESICMIEFDMNKYTCIESLSFVTFMRLAYAVECFEKIKGNSS